MWEEICIARDGQDCQVVVEQVHSMPRDGVRQAFAFGTAYGIVIAIAQRLHCPFHFVSPQRWKRDMELTSDKEDCRMKAISLFPEGYEHLSKRNTITEQRLCYWQNGYADNSKETKWNTKQQWQLITS